MEYKSNGLSIDLLIWKPSSFDRATQKIADDLIQEEAHPIQKVARIV